VCSVAVKWLIVLGSRFYETQPCSIGVVTSRKLMRRPRDVYGPCRLRLLDFPELWQDEDTYHDLGIAQAVSTGCKHRECDIEGAGI
jgi:hypothetical protein